MDRILIEDLLVRCTIGVSAEERREKEDVIVNIVLSGDFSRASKSDRIEEALDYRKLKKRVFALVEKSRYSLVEALADRIASLCLSSQGVSEVLVRVEKPSVLRFARSVGVEVSRKAADLEAVEVFLALGSNIGAEGNVLEAVRQLQERVRVVAASNFYETQAVGERKAPPFINGMLKVETFLPADDLKFSVLRPIEERLGRLRSEDKNAPRTIDIDLILYGDRVIKQEDLTVPDPEIERREYLAVPLSELAPELALPGNGMRISDLARSFSRQMKLLEDYTVRIRQEISLGEPTAPFQRAG